MPRSRVARAARAAPCERRGRQAGRAALTLILTPTLTLTTNPDPNPNPNPNSNPNPNPNPNPSVCAIQVGLLLGRQAKARQLWVSAGGGAPSAPGTDNADAAPPSPPPPALTHLDLGGLTRISDEALLKLV